jgi:hypothetical protein
MSGNEPAKYQNYPKVGDKLTCIKSKTYHKWFSVTKGKTYKVVDNIDMLNGYFHVKADERGAMYVRLEPEILAEAFGVNLQVKVNTDDEK